jgi:iron complex transport system permease protein
MMRLAARGARPVAFKLALLAVALAAAAILSCCIGRYTLPPSTVIRLFIARIGGGAGDWPAQAETVVMTVRLPRIMAAMLIGMALSSSGAAFQGLFRNPLVSPDILGVSAGAGLGASTAVLLAMGPVGIQLMAFAFGIVAVLGTYLIATRSAGGDEQMLMLILSGVVVAAFFTALISAIKYFSDPDTALPQIVFWLMGALSSLDPASLGAAAIPMLAGFAVLMLLRWNLDILAFGDDEARALGIDTALVRPAIVAAATLATASAVAICGIVGLVGLVVPHMARALFGPNFATLVPASALLGALFLLVMDDLARTLMVGELPLGVLTEIVGAPLFLVLLNRAQQAWT